MAGWIAVCTAAVFALSAWAMASPVGSSPDDDYHLASIWCAQGIDGDGCRRVKGEPDWRGLPPLASGLAPCYATDFMVSASCQDALVDQPPHLTPHGNWGNAYPPYFYAAMSLFVGDDVPRAALVMRLFNTLIVVAMITALAVLLPRRRRPLAAVPLVITAVPLSISILPSNNPSSWAVLGAAALWPALYVAFEVDGRRRWALSAFALLAAFIGSGSRADGCLFVAMAAVLVLLMRIRHLRRAPVVTAAALLSIAVAGAIFVSAGHSSALVDGFGYTRPELTTTQLFLVNLSSLPTLWLGIFSSGPLGRNGWLDTPFPPMISLLTIAIWFPILLQGLKRVFPVKVMALALIGAALFVHPMVLLMRAHVMVGEGVQPRYLLPVLVIFTGLCLLGTRGVTLRLTPVAYWVSVTALGLAHTVSLHIQIRRYVTGLDVSKIIFGDNLEWWWWDGAPGPTLVWLVGSVAFVVVTAGVLWQCRVVPGRPRGSVTGATGAGRSPARPTPQA